MLRPLPLLALAASLLAVGCFSDVPVEGTAGADSSGGSQGTTTEAGTGENGNTTTAVTDQSTSETATSASASDSGNTTEGAEATTELTGPSSETGEPLPTVCPLFRDTFEDGVEDPLWRQSLGPATTEVGGESVITVTGALNDQFVTMAVLPEDGGFAGGAMLVELGTLPFDVGVRTTLWVRPLSHDGRISYNLVDRGVGLGLEARITPELGDPQIVATLDWDPRTMGWLRLREGDSMLYFETSSDGMTFATFHEMTTPFDVGEAEVGFAGHNDVELTSDVEVSVRAFEFICGEA